MMATFVDITKIMAVFNIVVAIFFIQERKLVLSVLLVPVYIYCTLVVNNLSDRYKEEGRSFNRFDRQASLNVVHVMHVPNDPSTSGLSEIVNGIRPSELPPRYEAFTNAGMNSSPNFDGNKLFSMS